MQLICTTCGLPSSSVAAATPITQQQQADAEPLDPATTCAKCRTPLQPPTAFDCARLGLLDELKEIIASVRNQLPLVCVRNGTNRHAAESLDRRPILM